MIFIRRAERCGMLSNVCVLVIRKLQLMQLLWPDSNRFICLLAAIYI
ncbi:hypothetical protein LSAJ160_100025 [Latilactobacillus sakei]|nr:hypothetical protein LSAJ160_100025 [Latilactobacillus sakei]